MNVQTFAPNAPLPSDHYNGVQQEVEGLRRVLSRLLADVGGYAGTATNNGSVVEQSPQNSGQVRVSGPATLVVPITSVADAASEPMYVPAAFTTVAVPALNTTAGQSRNDLVVATVNLGNLNTYSYTVVQGTPATTGSQVDPALPANSLKLARITRVHGAGLITNAMITDLRIRATATP